MIPNRVTDRPQIPPVRQYAEKFNYIIRLLQSSSSNSSHSAIFFDQFPMETQFNPSYSLYMLLSLLSLSLSLSIATSFSPIDNYLLNCGSTEPTTTDADHRQFTGDKFDSSSKFLSASRTTAVHDSNPHPNLSPIYHTARIFTRPSKYVFAVKDRGTHLVRLHFRKFNFENFDHCHAQFHVSANGFVLLYNFTVDDAQQNPRIKDYMIWVDDDKLEIVFTPSKRSKFGFVSAIEVISAPKDLIADVAQFVSNERNERVYGLKKSALETVYRVNVGGVKVTPFNDTLWRTWVTDKEFLKSSDGLEKVYFSGRINYQRGGASREVGPDNVYNTARLISSSDASIPKLNITWVFPVTKGFQYLVRTHFCDIASIALGLLHFNVYVNGNLAFENLDLTSLTNAMLASPFYADFMVDSDSSGVLTVSVGPSNISRAHAVDAILNGVEIMKINNSMGSLDGEVCVGIVSKGWSRSGLHFGFYVPCFVAVGMLIAAFVIMQRRKDGFKESIAWSRLPVDVSEVDLKCKVPAFSGKM